MEQEPEPELEYYSDEYFSAEETEEQPPKKNVKKEASEKPRNKKSKSKVSYSMLCEICIKILARDRFVRYSQNLRYHREISGNNSLSLARSVESDETSSN